MANGGRRREGQMHLQYLPYIWIASMQGFFLPPQHRNTVYRWIPYEKESHFSAKIMAISPPEEEIWPFEYQGHLDFPTVYLIYLDCHITTFKGVSTLHCQELVESYNSSKCSRRNRLQLREVSKSKYTPRFPLFLPAELDRAQIDFLSQISIVLVTVPTIVDRSTMSRQVRKQIGTYEQELALKEIFVGG